jgi:CRP/FNR family transcriptional regulator
MQIVALQTRATAQTAATVEGLDQLMSGHRRLREGEALYHEGEKCHSIHAIRSGTVKSTVTLRDGREQVMAFQIAGEILGMDGIASGSHASTVVALEETHVCAIPYADLCDLAAGDAQLQHLISRLLSREIVREQELMVLLGCMSAEQRLAGFLLNFSGKMSERGYSASEFNLRMSRADIGSYLGMTLETVSRSFSSLQKQRVLDVDKKCIRIREPETLRHAFDAHVQ